MFFGAANNKLGRIHPAPLIFTVQTTGASETFTIPPCQNEGTFDALIDWGDGSAASTITTYNDADLAHVYDSAGTYTISIYGQFPNIYFNNTGDAAKVREVVQLGEMGWTRLDEAFYGCSGLTSFKSGVCDTSNVVFFTNMCLSCTSLVTVDITTVDGSSATAMVAMFKSCSAMTSITMPPSGFVTATMDQPGYIFSACTSLTSVDVSGWDMSGCRDCTGMFSTCSALTTLDLSSWDTSTMTKCHTMFQNCTLLATLDVSSFDTSNVTAMSYMFKGCPALTSIDVTGFDTTKVTTMDYMFYQSSSLSSVDISGFLIPALTTALGMFNGCAANVLGTTIYDETLIAWEAQTELTGVSIDFKAATQYSAGAAATARGVLTGTSTWTIIDGGQVP